MNFPSRTSYKWMSKAMRNGLRLLSSVAQVSLILWRRTLRHFSCTLTRIGSAVTNASESPEEIQEKSSGDASDMGVDSKSDCRPLGSNACCGDCEWITAVRLLPLGGGHSLRIQFELCRKCGDWQPTWQVDDIRREFARNDDDGHHFRFVGETWRYGRRTMMQAVNPE